MCKLIKYFTKTRMEVFQYREGTHCGIEVRRKERQIRTIFYT